MIVTNALDSAANTLLHLMFTQQIASGASMELITTYHFTIYIMGIMGFLLLVQLIIADLAGIKSGHQAGYPIPPDRNNFLFRAARAHANTNESISTFILFAITGMLSSANPFWLNVLSISYFLCRIAHMLFYYSNQKALRSTVFGISLVALLGMFITTLTAWL